jgi:protein phosphatase
VNTAVRDDDTLPSDLALALGRPVRSWAIGETPVSSWAAASETGLQRSHNEDAWGQRAGSVFVVADGMGGRPGGAVAAAAAVETLLDELAAGPASDRTAIDHARIDWRQVMRRANEAVVAAGRRAGHDHVGAAIAVVCSRVNGTLVAHAGDVRVYRLREGAREAVTNDHTVATELEFAGLRPDDVPDARGRLGALASFLGGGDAWQSFTVRMLDIRGGDRLVMCTDGVYRHVSSEVWRAAAGRPSCQELVDHLVTSARRAAGPDDATALAMRLGAAP